MAKLLTVAEKLAALRSQMKIDGIDALIVPQADPHGSEYVAEYWQARRWVSGFSGSAGDLLILADGSALWADSRYWLQAANQLAGSEIAVMEEGKPTTPSIVEYLATHLPSGASVGIDGSLISADKAVALGAELAAVGLKLKLVSDPVAVVWADRPELPMSELIIHDISYAGESAKSKIAGALEAVKAAGGNALFVADLAEIAWLLNLRGMDIECNPVVVSYLYLSESLNVWFVDERKLTDAVREYLAREGVTTAPYSVAGNFLSNLGSGIVLCADLHSLSASFAERARGSKAKLLPLASPIALPKAIRNEVQIAGTRQAMLRDGVAMAYAFCELERRLAAGECLTELTVAELLERERSRQPGYLCLSFETIAGFADHGAIVHYSADERSAYTLSPDNLLLVDSGATYLYGTTDITRTFSLGCPTEEQRHDFTLVLKGMIDLARAVFPVGTRGAQLDVLARAPMWREGLGYLHGTGHGVGHCLNVHEGPQSIRMQENPVVLRPGMLTSDEPGLYRAGKYGIRCENLVLTVEDCSTEFGDFLRFETMTLFPFDATLVDRDMLDRDEIAWFNDYQARVLRELEPAVESAEVKEWLRAKCATI